MKPTDKTLIRNRINKSVLVVCVSAFIASCGGEEGVTVVERLPGQGQHTAHTDIEQGVWPPQPLGMTNIQPLAASARIGAEVSLINASRAVVMNNPAVRQLLGSDYIEFTGSLGDDKGDVASSFVFFSYSNNHTVEVRRLRSGGIATTTYPATQFQPAEQTQEVERAIALANSALTDTGFETQGLKGTAMLAYPRASEATDAGQQYYPQRVLYVTFGPGDGELPVYSALANLTTGTVSEAGLIR